MMCETFTKNYGVCILLIGLLYITIKSEKGLILNICVLVQRWLMRLPRFG